MTTTPGCSENLDPHLLVREGTSRDRRRLEELSPAFIRVDEHDASDWMVYAQRYAEYINFFADKDSVAGDWQAFFNSDPSAMLSVAATQHVDFFKSNIAGYFSKLRDQTATIEDMKTNLAHAFNVLASLAWQLERLKEMLPDSVALKNILKNSIQTELAVSFERLMAYRLAIADDIGQAAFPYAWEILGSRIEPYSEIVNYPFSSDWYQHTSRTSWSEYVTNIEADDRVVGGLQSDTDSKDRINYAAGYNLFTGIFDLFVKSYSRTVAEARKSLELTFTENDDHLPHYALFLAFLQLLTLARDHANTLTAKHIDFYYKKILQLSEKTAEPDHAHVIFQLAKRQVSHQVKAGTEFDAGKDEGGNDRIYRLTEDITVNTARVAELKAAALTSSALYAFPAIDSEDGRGAELTSISKEWSPFVSRIDVKNLAQIGFALASHYLLLSEGHRIIQLNLSLTPPVSPKALCSSFDFFLTGDQGWILAALSKSLESMNVTPSKNVAISLVLEGGLPAVVPLRAEAHGPDLPPGIPVLKAVLKTGRPEALTFVQLQSLRLNTGESSLSVAVGYRNLDDDRPDELGTGLKKIQVLNKFGELKTDKPFQPFGAMPESGDYLIVGCDEVFQKKHAAIQFSVVWKNLPEWRGNIDFDWVNDFAPNVSLTYLKNGVWNINAPDMNDVPIFRSARADITFPTTKLPLPDEAIPDVHYDEQPYRQDRRNGFVKITLLDDFDHKLYQATLSRYFLRVAQKDPALTNDRGALRDLVYDFTGGKYVPKNKFTFKEDFIEHFSKAFPNEPYTPEIASISLSYTATVRLSEPQVVCHWLYPFGYKTVTASAQAIKLMPEFESQAEFYIGIEGLQPPQNLNLLFQVSEGSADPNVKKPEKHIEWTVLAGNRWQTFNATDIGDATGQLTRSGIIRFAIPKEATNNETLFLPAGKHWLRARVDRFPNAVAKVIAVVAQAAPLKFKTDENAKNFSTEPLPSGVIGKLRLPDAAIKKIEQPYPTFGGRSEEDSEQFRTRVSERLRHKNRAIMLWDYEHLILEAFPSIYKVKCLNHMHVEAFEDGTRIYNELAPGHVTLVTIPKSSNLTATDPLKPFTSLGDLDLIKQFAEQHASCFVKLHAVNPIFEDIRVDFGVKFYPGKDEKFHKELLIREVIRFLSPWAFTDTGRLEFGGTIYKSALINFVEERDYVDFVTDFRLFQPKTVITGDRQTIVDGPDLEEAVAATAISILVSAPADRHTVRVLPSAASPSQTQ